MVLLPQQFNGAGEVYQPSVWRVYPPSVWRACLPLAGLPTVNLAGYENTKEQLAISIVCMATGTDPPACIAM